MSTSIEALVAQAKELSAEQNFDASAEVFAEIFRQDPNSRAGISALAEVMVDVGQVETGLALLADSVDLDTPDPFVLRTIANLLRGQDRLVEAADFLLCALAHSPEDQELFVETRELFASLGRSEEFANAFKESEQAEASDSSEK